MNAVDELKRTAGYSAVDRYVERGMCVGLGTGTTAHWATVRTGERVAAGEQLTAVATSEGTAQLARDHGIPLVPFGECEIDVAIDGADEVAADWSLTKGGGGALFREKAVALLARTFVVIVTPEKLVERLGAFHTPVEVVPYSLRYVERAITAAFGVSVTRRGGEEHPFVTDNGNAILDCAFGAIVDPAALDGELRGLHGVVATGLFANDLTDVVIVAAPDGVRELEHPARAGTDARMA